MELRGHIPSTYTVTLKILRSLSALRTERPKEPALGLKCVQTYIEGY